MRALYTGNACRNEDGQAALKWEGAFDSDIAASDNARNGWVGAGSWILGKKGGNDPAPDRIGMTSGPPAAPSPRVDSSSTTSSPTTLTRALLIAAGRITVALPRDETLTPT